MQDHLEALNGTREADERRYKNHDVPRGGKLLAKVRRASLLTTDIYVRISLGEAIEAVGSGLDQ